MAFKVWESFVEVKAVTNELPSSYRIFNIDFFNGLALLFIGFSFLIVLFVKKADAIFTPDIYCVSVSAVISVSGVRMGYNKSNAEQ
ncbi:hypothetical protein ACDL36_11415 [Corynebacterium diphtheriae]|uniref:hypothetical protein n=1 Tax=Corynebacterium diphtheriae TaxID=1717 RepID=UPI0035309052